MKPFLSIIGLTVRTTLNRRLITTVTLLGIIVAAVIILFANMSLDQTARVVADFGLAATIILTIIISIITTANLVLAEQERGTLLIILPKPIARAEFIVAKYLGLLVCAIGIYAILCVIVFGGAAFFVTLPWVDIILTALAGSLELMVLLALATLAAAFTTPILATVLTLGMFIIGHLLSLILYATASAAPILRTVAQGIYYLLPNLEKFNLRELYISSHLLSASYYGWMVLYAVVYTAAVLIIATTLFKHREW